MPNPVRRKERIKTRAKLNRVDVHARKIRGMSDTIDNLSKRLEKLEEKGKQ